MAAGEGLAAMEATLAQDLEAMETQVSLLFITIVPEPRACKQSD